MVALGFVRPRNLSDSSVLAPLRQDHEQPEAGGVPGGAAPAPPPPRGAGGPRGPAPPEPGRAGSRPARPPPAHIDACQRDNGVTAPEITVAVPFAPRASSWARGSLNTNSDPTGAPSSTKTSTLELST